MLRPEAGARVVIERAGVVLVSWPLGGDRHPDLAVVDELARLQLDARRLGWRVKVFDASLALWELLDLVGLADLVVTVARGPSEVGRQSEGGEQLGVEEAVVPDDPVA